MATNTGVAGGAGAAGGAISGAATGTAVAPGIGTAIGAILGAILGGFSGGSSAKSGNQAYAKVENVKKDIKVNTGHALNFFNENYTHPSFSTQYSDYITPEEWNAIADQELPKVSSDPYYGGLDTSYVSKYIFDKSGNPINFNTVPGVGIARDLDDFITQKQASGNNINQGGGMTLTDILNKGQEGLYSVIDYYSAQALAKQREANQSINNQQPINPGGITMVQDNMPFIIGIIVVVVVIIFLRKRGAR